MIRKKDNNRIKALLVFAAKSANIFLKFAQRFDGIERMNLYPLLGLSVEMLTEQL